MPDTITFALLAAYFFNAFAALFPLVNPFDTVPLFLSLTSRHRAEERARQARDASLYSGGIMFGALLAGHLVIEFLGISIPALRVAGGLIVAFLGFRMLFPHPDSENAALAEGRGETDYALIPLAFPSLCGAGPISIIITFSSHITILSAPGHKVLGYGVAVFTILVVTALAWVILRCSIPLSRKLGARGLEAMGRLMGMLMVCIGTQLVANGVMGFAALAQNPPPS